MAHSRFSIPLFAVGLLAIAACMTYWVTTKNIFGLTSFNNSDAAERVLSVDGIGVGAEGDKNSAGAFFDIKKIKKVITSGAQKITGAQELEEAAGSGIGVAESSGAAAVAETGKITAESNSKIVVGYAQSAMSQRDYELMLLWGKYSATIPRLYSHPRDENTEAILGRVGKISMELDLQGYNVQSESELIKIAVAGEREGARALSFQYAKNNTVESLAWAMVANAIAENDYYLYVCTEEFTSCSESLFAQAEVKAKTFIGVYYFVLK